MRLTIVIPALNEEDAIGSTIERCLKAREVIIADSPVRHVEIVVVNDGSSDRTAEIAAGFGDVNLINFETGADSPGHFRTQRCTRRVLRCLR